MYVIVIWWLFPGKPWLYILDDKYSAGAERCQHFYDIIANHIQEIYPVARFTGHCVWWTPPL